MYAIRSYYAIHVLEAEWSYLNRPERISLLAERFLALAPLSADHVVSINDLPQRPEPGDTDEVPGRITSYNVCYTKLLRPRSTSRVERRY